MSEPNTSAKTMCFNTLVLEQTPEAISDAIKLCKNLGYTDQNIDDLIFLTEATLNISIPANAGSVPSDMRCNCAYIKEKHYLYNACSVCHSNPEYNKTAEQRDFNILIHIINLKKNSGFFVKSKEKRIMEKFKSCTKCSTTEKGAPVYLPIGRDIYSIIASAVHNSEADDLHKKETIKKYIREDDIYKEWCFIHSEYCDANGGNSIAKTIINYIYTANPKDAGKFEDIKEFYIPKKATSNTSQNSLQDVLPAPAFTLESTPDPAKQETRKTHELTAPDVMDFSDLYMTPGSLPMPEMFMENNSIAGEALEPIREDICEEKTSETMTPVPADTEESSSEEEYYPAPEDTAENNTDNSELTADSDTDTNDEETIEESVPSPDIPTQELSEETVPVLQGVVLEDEIPLPEEEPDKETPITEVMIPSVSRLVLANAGYVSLDQQKAQLLTEKIIKSHKTVTADIIHFTEHAGIFASLTFQTEKYMLTDRQFSFFKKLFSSEKFTVLTGNIASLYAVLISNQIKPKVRLLQPKGKRRTEYLSSLLKGNISLDGLKDWEMADNVDTDILKAYAYTFRPGTGDEQNLIMTNDLPEIVKKQYIDDEKARLLYLVIMDRNIPRKGWEVIKDDVIASMEYNDVFTKHKAQIHYIDNEFLTFIFLVPQDKIRSLQTVLAYLVPMILDDLKCSSGIGFKIRKAVRTQTTDQNTNTRKEN